MISIGRPISGIEKEGRDGRVTEGIEGNDIEGIGMLRLGREILISIGSPISGIEKEGRLGRVTEGKEGSDIDGIGIDKAGSVMLKAQRLTT